jgi:hypothetical protein
MAPEFDDIPDRLGRVIETYIGQGQAAAMLELKPVAFHPYEAAARPALPLAITPPCSQTTKWLREIDNVSRELGWSGPHEIRAAVSAHVPRAHYLRIRFPCQDAVVLQARCGVSATACSRRSRNGAGHVKRRGSLPRPGFNLREMTDPPTNS